MQKGNADILNFYFSFSGCVTTLLLHLHRSRIRVSDLISAFAKDYFVTETHKLNLKRQRKHLKCVFANIILQNSPYWKRNSRVFFMNCCCSRSALYSGFFPATDICATDHLKDNLKVCFQFSYVCIISGVLHKKLKMSDHEKRN